MEYERKDVKVAALDGKNCRTVMVHNMRTRKRVIQVVMSSSVRPGKSDKGRWIWHLHSSGEATKLADRYHDLGTRRNQQELQKQKSPKLGSWKCSWFAHGFNIHFEFIKVPRCRDVFMCALKDQDTWYVVIYEEGFGVPAYAVYQDATGNAKTLLWTGVKCWRSSCCLLETTYKEANWRRFVFANKLYF